MLYGWSKNPSLRSMGPDRYRRHVIRNGACRHFQLSLPPPPPNGDLVNLFVYDGCNRNMRKSGHGGRVSIFILNKLSSQTRKFIFNSAFVEQRDDTDASSLLIIVQTFKQVCVCVCVRVVNCCSYTEHNIIDTFQLKTATNSLKMCNI